MTLREFSTFYYDRKYSGSRMPKHAQPRKPFSDKSANDLTKAILAFFEYKGIKAWRQSSEGRYLKGREYTDWAGRKKEEKGMYIPRNKGGRGSADVTVTLPPMGRRLEVEVKYGADRQSEDQKKFQAEIEAAGGLYMIANTWDGFYFLVSKILV